MDPTPDSDRCARSGWLCRLETIVISPMAFFLLGAALGVGGLVNSEHAYSFDDVSRARAMWFTITSAAFFVGAAILGSRRRSLDR
jgi:hypothetical protein